jgi:hypothetical protein
MGIIKTIKPFLLVAVGFITLLGFKNKETLKPFTTTTYNYVSNTPFQRLRWNTNALNLLERSIDRDTNNPAYFKRESSWTVCSSLGCTVPDMTKYICSITYCEESTADGGDDGAITLQEAIDGLYIAYMTNQAMPSSLIIGTATIIISASDVAH